MFGATYALKDCLEAHGMFGTSLTIAVESEYVRLFGEVDAEVEDRVTWLIQGMTAKIQNTVVQLRVIYKPAVETHASVKEFLKKLGEIPTIFVVA